MERKQIIDALLSSNGNKRVKDLTIKSVTVREVESKNGSTYVRLGLTLDKEVDGYIANEENGEYELKKTNIIFVSLISMCANLRENDKTSFAVNHFLENPQSMQVVLNRAKIDIIQEAVAVGQIYINPFSTNQTPEDTDAVTHDMIVNHVINVTISDTASKLVERLADKMLGI